MAKREYIQIESSRIASYAQVESLMYFDNGDWVVNRKLAKKTYLCRTSDGIVVYFHSSPIITWSENDLVTLDGMHYYTQSTRALFNEWLPSGISIEVINDYWWVCGLNLNPQVYFHRGMQIDLHTMTEFTRPYELDRHTVEWNDTMIQTNSYALLKGPHKDRNKKVGA